MNGLREFLRTDPRDTGCGRAMQLLHVYAELILSGEDASSRHPDLAAHLRVCGPCTEDLETLLAAVRGELR
jgi:hypothetical protein